MTLQLLHGDCLELMKTLPNKSVDLFICDLPYGCLEPKRKRTEEYLKQTKHSHTGGCAWDIKLDLTQFWDQVKRLCKNDNTPVIHFCNTRFGAELIASNPSWFRYDLVWSKSNGVGFLSANKQPLRSHEMIYVFSKKGAYYKRINVEVEGAKEWKQFGKVGVSGVYDLVRDNPVVRPVGTITSQAGWRCVKSVIEVENKKGKGNHPTQKPLDLYKWLITRYCPEGGTVLDPTAGSFNSGLASKELGLNYIGIEKDDTFFEKGKSKFESTV